MRHQTKRLDAAKLEGAILVAFLIQRMRDRFECAN